MEATNTRGEIFVVGDEMFMIETDVYSKKMKGRQLRVESLKRNDACPTGWVIVARDVLSGKIFPRPMDSDWFTKEKESNG